MKTSAERPCRVCYSASIAMCLWRISTQLERLWKLQTFVTSLLAKDVFCRWIGEGESFYELFSEHILKKICTNCIKSLNMLNYEMSCYRNPLPTFQSLTF